MSPASAPVLVAAVADDAVEVARLGQHGLDGLQVLRVQGDFEHPGVVGNVLRHPQAGADDDTGDGRAVQDVPDGNVGDADAVFVGDGAEGGQQLLEQAPPAPGVDHLLVLAQTGRVQLCACGLGPAEVAVGQEPAADSAVGQQRAAMLVAERGHGHLRAAVDQGVLHLVGDDPNAVVCDVPHPPGVEIGEGHFSDAPLVPQVGQVGEGVEVALVPIVPPVELQQVKAVYIHAPAGNIDVPLHHLSGHWSRPRHPFGEGLDAGQGLGTALCGELPAEFADEVFGGAVVVGKVPGGEPGIDVVEHAPDCGPGFNGPVGAGNLPHAVQDAADLQVLRQLVTACFGQSHGHLCGDYSPVEETEWACG